MILLRPGPGSDTVTAGLGSSATATAMVHSGMAIRSCAEANRLDGSLSQHLCEDVGAGEGQAFLGHDGDGVDAQLRGHLAGEVIGAQERQVVTVPERREPRNVEASWSRRPPALPPCHESSCNTVTADSGGSGSQPSLTREKTSQESTANPKRRRKGFTPRNTSSPAQSARAAEARTTRTARTQPQGCPSHITADASNHTANCQLGSWASVIRPVFRLRNIQSRNPMRSSIGSGVLNDVLLRVDVLAGDPTGCAVFRVDCDPLRTKARPARLVAVLAEVRDGVAFLFRQTGVIGFLGRCIAAFLKQDR